MTSRRCELRLVWTGLGVVFGTALGLLVGLLLFEGSVWAPFVGASAGLVIGAIVDGRASGPD
jgi:hypothetical protein